MNNSHLQLHLIRTKMNDWRTDCRRWRCVAEDGDERDRKLL